MITRLATIYILILVFATWGFAIGRYEVFPFSIIKAYYDETRAFLEGDPHGQKIPLKDKILYHLQEKKNKYPYSGFIRRDLDFVDPGYLLISRFSEEYNQVIVALVRIQNFQKVHTWIPDFKAIFKHTALFEYSATSTSQYRLRHPLLLPDGSIVAHLNRGVLIKIDRCGSLIWLNDRQPFHHTVEMMHDGNLVVPIENEPQIQEFPSDFRDDGFAILSPEGKIIKRFSVGKILMDSGHRGLFLGAGRFEDDRTHLNDAQPINESVGMARVGDIALSIRHLSTVLLYRPNSNEVIWLKTGPWLYQHDINMLPNGQFSIFGNNMFEYGEEMMRPESTSEVYILNPETEIVETPYTVALGKLHVVSHTEGRARILENGDVFIEESDFHRLLRLSKDGARWEFVNSISDRTTGTIHWTRYLTSKEVDASWSGQNCD